MRPFLWDNSVQLLLRSLGMLHGQLPAPQLALGCHARLLGLAAADVMSVMPDE